MPRFDIVASTENNTYLVWQAMLFHYSCVQHLGQAPIVVVHKGDEPLLTGFERIAAAGGRVQIAPNYRQWGGVNYPPRNTAATLRHVVSDADYLILCDPDMIFLRPLNWQTCALSDRQVSFDHVAYLDPDRAVYQPMLDQACRQFGVEPRRLRDRPISGGVPHIIPHSLQQPLSAAWLEGIQRFPTIGPWNVEAAGALSRQCHVGPQKDWLATMWAVVLAMHRLELEPIMTRWCINNFNGNDAMPPSRSRGTRPVGAAVGSEDSTHPTEPTILHYCYAAPGFSKHEFDSPEASERLVWQVPADDGTISGAIRGQLRAARKYYGLRK